MLCLAEIT